MLLILKYFKLLETFFLFLVLLLSNKCYTQETKSVDELFKIARETAFEKKDYKTAGIICKNILGKSPDYYDVSVFLGRLYAWDGNYDSSRIILNNVIKKDSANYEAINAIMDIEYWSDNPGKVLVYADLGLKNYPRSEEYLLKKAKAFSDLNRYDEAFTEIEKIFKINNSYTDAIVFSERLKEKLISNSIGFTYDYDKFNKTFDPWHALSVSYSRKTPIGSVIGRLNYVKRFGDDGIQYEIDMYPHFADGFYAYVNYGYSADDIFPLYRVGLSLYYSLPLSFEIEGGFRYLKFSSTDAMVYTVALGKYYSNFWFLLRTYITPQLKKASKSYHFLVRYYLSDADEYLNLLVGSGISYDFKSIYQDYFLIANKFSLEYQTKLTRRLLLNISTGYSSDEIRPDLFRDRLSFGFGWKFIF